MMMTCACEVAPPSATPTVAPTASPAQSSEQTHTPVLVPTENLLPYPNVSNSKLLYGTSFNTPFFEVWSSEDIKYFNLNLVIPNDQGKFNDKLGTENYEYTWLLGYHNAEIEPKTEDDIIGFYTVTPKETFSKNENETVYRLSVADSPEGDFTKYLEVGTPYLFLIVILKNGEPVAVTYTSCVWNNEFVQARDNYYTPTSTPTLTLEDTLPHPTEFLFTPKNGYILMGWGMSPQIEIYEDDKSKEYLGVEFATDSKIKGNSISWEEVEYCTWHVLYYNAEVEIKSVEDFIGYYTADFVSVEECEDGIILYKVKISDLEEGDFIKDFEVGKTYMFVWTLISKDNVPGFILSNICWTEELAEIRDNFYAANGND